LWLVQRMLGVRYVALMGIMLHLTHSPHSLALLQDTFWQTETGGIIITPLPGCTPQKPGAATLPFFGASVVRLGWFDVAEPILLLVDLLLLLQRPRSLPFCERRS
jgi:hypothetical protein